MDKMEFTELLKKHFTNWDNQRLTLFDEYAKFLRQENEKFNLTRLASEDKIYEKYFFASLTPFLDMDLKNKAILDIGSGSGIPGIALKIIEPTIRLFIAEASAKKVAFLKTLCGLLRFSDVVINQQRAEIVPTSMIEKFDIVTSRAVSSVPIMIEISAAYAKIGGVICVPKSINYEHELNAARPLLELLNLEMISCNEFILNKISYFTITYSKLKSTPKKYPRSWKEIIQHNEQSN